MNLSPNRCVRIGFASRIAFPASVIHCARHVHIIAVELTSLYRTFIADYLGRVSSASLLLFLSSFLPLLWRRCMARGEFRNQLAELDQ